MAAKDVKDLNGSFPMVIQTVLDGMRHVIHIPEALPVGHTFKIIVTSPLTMEKVMTALNRVERAITSDDE